MLLTSRVPSAATIAIAVLFLFIAGWQLVPASTGPIWMVGVGGGEPDSLNPDPATSSESACALEENPDPGPGFERVDLSLWPRVEEDFDLLKSNSMVGVGDISPYELESLVHALDIDPHNMLDVNETDLQLVINYFSIVSSYDSTGVNEQNFLLFPSCAGSGIDEFELSHLDMYIVQKSTDDDAGRCAAAFTDTLEDLPYSEGYDEYHYNSFQVLDGRNAQGDTLEWPQKAVAGAAHEIQHALWASDKWELGSMRDHGNFNEFFASAASMLAKPPRIGTQENDIPYAQSLIPPLGPLKCNQAPSEPEVCEATWYDWVDEQDCRYGYVTWGIFAAYIIEQYSESPYTDDLLHRWAQSHDGPGGQMTRDMCGFAAVLEDPDYAYLGGDDGGYRASKIFHEFSVARWVDDASYSSAYSFGDSISPTESFGYFGKHDTGDGDHNCYEIAIPPEFLVGEDSDGSWVSVPGNGSDPAAECTDGWNDPADTTYCDNLYCDPVRVRLWGSYYIGFRADTGYYDASKSDRYLKVKVDWDENAMCDSTELWVTILKYSSAGSGIFDDGENVTWAYTDQFSSSDSIVVAVHDFHEGGNEAAALVLSMVPTMFDTCLVECTQVVDPVRYNCMPRHTTSWSPTGTRQDLDFEYSFAVLQEPQGGSCPHLSAFADGHLVNDNNVLAGALMGSDRLDLYPIRNPPTARADGLYHLRLSEAKDDRSFFDQVQLFAFDASPGTGLALGPDGTPVTYSSMVVPIECHDNRGNDVLAAVASRDGREAVIPSDGWIDVKFSAVGRSTGGIGTVGNPGSKIDPPVGRASADSQNGAVDLTSLCYRESPMTRFIEAPEDALQEDGTVVMRMEAPVEFHVDHLFFSSYASVSLEGGECALTSATHSTEGPVLRQLRDADSAYAVLGKGEHIDLLFQERAPDPIMERHFVFASRGRYEHVNTRQAINPEEESVRAVEMTTYPNPAVSSTSIRFSVPQPGGPCSVSVYNIAGRLVRDLGTERFDSGVYEVSWDGKDDSGQNVAAGVYFIRVNSPGSRSESKLVVIR